MSSKFSLARGLSKLSSVNAAYVFIGGVVILSIATLVMVVAQPDVVRTSSKTTSNKLYLSVPGQKLGRDSIIEVKVMADSGGTKVNAVQTKIEYPAEILLFQTIRPGSAFPVEAATSTATPGVIMVGRGTQPGSAGVSGKNEIVTLSFKVLADTAERSLIKFDSEFSLLVRASDNKNILSGTSGVYLDAKD